MSEASDLQKITLYNGINMPTVALGSFFGPAGAPGSLPMDKVKDVIGQAIDIGYRHIDTAWSYQNERAIGEAVKEKIQEGVITREEMFITSKLSFAHHEPAFVKDCLKASLKQLDMDYVDLYLIHGPVPFVQVGVEEQPIWDGTALLDHNNDHVKTWKALEECVRAGLARSIGVSNFNLKQVCHIVDHAEIQPAVNQVELHPYLTQQELVDGCKAKNVVVEAYAPLGQGHSCWAKEAPSPIHDPVIKEIASRLGRTPAQVILRYKLQRGVALAVRSSNQTRLRENIQLFDFTLSNDDMATLAKLNRNDRLGELPNQRSHKDYPYDS